jgi:hypothetical protein
MRHRKCRDAGEASARGAWDIREDLVERFKWGGKDFWMREYLRDYSVKGVCMEGRNEIV